MKIPKPRKLPSGSWFCQTMIDGKRISVTAPTKSECTTRVIALKVQTDESGHSEASGDILLGEAIDRYIADRSDVLSPATIRGYNIIRNHRFQNFMDARLCDIPNWQKVINSEAKKCSAKTLRNAWGLISAVIKANGLDPGAVRLPLNISEERAFLQPEQIKVFVDAIHGEPYELEYLLALHGLRRSELLALEKADITDRIHVNKASVHDAANKMVTKGTTKNRTSTRSVPVMIDRLTELVSECPDGQLISSNMGTVNSHLAKVCRESSLPIITLHGLRHSFASLCYHLKISELQCMELGGWSDLTTMRKIYTHIADEDRRKAASELKGFFSH